jgi:hypothetical protein
MFSAIGADLVGTSNNCHPVERASFIDIKEVGDSLTYLLPEESPYVFWKSKVMEYIFTDTSLVIIERNNAAGVQRKINRYLYATTDFDNPVMETPGAGMTDYSCTIRVVMSSLPERVLSIDVDKKYFESHAKSFYLALCEIVELQAMQRRGYDLANNLVGKNQFMIQNASESFMAKMMIETATLIEATYKKYKYGYIFQKHLAK